MLGRPRGGEVRRAAPCGSSTRTWRTRQSSSAGGIAPPRPPRTVRETRASYGSYDPASGFTPSCHRTKSCGSRRATRPSQVVNDRRLLSVDPTGEQQAEERERRRQLVHGGSVPETLPRFKGDVDWAEFPDAHTFLRLRRSPNCRGIRLRRSFRTGRDRSVLLRT